MKIALIGNCQVQTIAAILGRAMPNAHLRMIDFSNSDTASASHRAEFVAGLDDDDLILTHWNRMEHVDTKTLKERHGEKVVTLGNFFFRGLHPDVCYLDQKVKGGEHLAGYHSWTILASFLRGETPEQAIRNFSPEWFEREKLLKPWDQHVSDMNAYDKIADFPVSDLVGSLARNEKCFHTINHPTLGLEAAYLQRAIGHLWGNREIDIAGLEDPLMTRMIIPVHDCVAEAYGLNFRTPQTWRFNGKDHDLREVVDLYYRRYEQAHARKHSPAILSPAELKRQPLVPRRGQNSPYRGRPRETFWKTGVQIPGPVAPPNFYTRKWPITRDDKIATAGSCFAQHIGRNLRRHGFGIMDVEPAPADLPADKRADSGYGIFSARYGNIYTARQLLQLAEEVFGLRPTPDHIAWQGPNGRWFDALRPGVEAHGMATAAEVFDERRKHMEAVRSLFLDADVLVFTLGLTEAWQDTTDGTILPTAPGTIAGSFDPSRHAFVNLSFADVRADMLAFMALMTRQRSKPLRYLFTVSPVPLTATATDAHVMVATAHSKAILRAVAGELGDLPEADYFPSFEIISNPWNSEPFFEADLRNVSQRGVDTVMRVFSAAHLDTEPAAAHVPDAEAVDAVVCEDARLDAFAT